MKNASEWFRWLTPILLGVLTASNARIHGRMDKIEASIVVAMKDSVAYTDKVAGPLSDGLREHAREITDLRIGLARVGRRMGNGGSGGDGR